MISDKHFVEFYDDVRSYDAAVGGDVPAPVKK